MDIAPEVLDAERVFRNLRQVVSGLVDNFSCDEEKKAIVFQVSGEPFETAFKLTVHTEKQLLTIYSKLPFTVAEPYRAGYATAVSRINYDRMYGATFDFSPDKGFTVYRQPVPFKKSLISPDLLEAAIRETLATVTRYVCYLFDVSHGIDAVMPEEA
jgi:hypothetical protein